MNKVIQKVVKSLLTVKSIVTILLTVVFCFLSVKGTVDGEQFMTIFSVIIAFYFGTQFQKTKDGDDSE